MRRYWGLVFIVVLYVASVIFLMINGVGFTQAVQFTFGPMSYFLSPGSYHSQTYKFLVSILPAILSLVIVGTIIYAIVRLITNRLKK